MTDSRTLGQSVPKEGLFIMDGIEGLRSLPKHSVEYAADRSALRHNPELLGCAPAAPGTVGGGEMGGQAEWCGAVLRTVPL